MKKSLLFLGMTILAGTLLLCCGNAGEFVLTDGNKAAVIYLPATEPECVRLAVEDLVNDVEKISGVRLPVQSVPPDPGEMAVRIVTLDKSGEVNDAQSLAGKWEAYRILTKGNNLIISGSDERGTMFGIYHFIAQFLGVDPLYFWSDLPHPSQKKLSWKKIDVVQDTPDFRYRGWFINDEDLLTEWFDNDGTRQIDYPFYGQVVHPEIMERVVEALVRLRMNLIIPASFIDIRNAPEAKLVQIAARRGVFLSMHHVEPMGVSAFTFFNYWKAKTGEKPLFSYYSSRSKLEEVWKVYAEEWAKYPNVIWQIGLRGIADRPMWMADPGIPQSNADRGKLISEAMETQWKLIREVDSRPNPPVTTTLWMEGSALNREGHLQIPGGTTVVFADNCPGWKWQQDFYESDRLETHTYGVYYHHQLWGAGPHLAQAIPPAQTYRVFQDAYDQNAREYAILNVSNVRPFLLGLATSGVMLYDFRGFDPDKFMDQWINRRFGKHSGDVLSLYKAYFEGFVLHDTQKVPMLLDGQTRSFALAQLTELKKQIQDPVAYERERAERESVRYAQRDATLAINDAHPKPRNDDDLLDKTVKQKLAHQAVLEKTEDIVKKLEPDQASFLQTNLISHLRIMVGLETWLEELLRTRESLSGAKIQEAHTYLQNAVDAFELIRAGQSLQTHSSKWVQWYKGEKKMNLLHCENLTKDVLTSLAHPATNL